MRSAIKNKGLIGLRRDHIGRCALHIFAKRGFDDTTVEAIARACHLGVGSVYRYVGKKEDILFLAIESFLNKGQALIEQFHNYSELSSPPEALSKIIRVLFEFYDTHQDSTMFVYHETRNLARKHRNWCFNLEESILSAIEHVLHKGVENGDFYTSNARVIAHNILILAEMWAIRRWFLKKQQPLEEHIRQQTEFVLRAVRSHENDTTLEATINAQGV